MNPRELNALIQNIVEQLGILQLRDTTWVIPMGSKYALQLTRVR